MQTNYPNNQNGFTVYDTVPQPPAYPIYPPQSVPKRKNDISRILSSIQLGLKAIFIILLFVPGMFCINYSYSSDVFEELIITESFFNISTSEYDLPISAFDKLCFDFFYITFVIIVIFIVADFIFSIIRAAVPKFAKKGQWQFIFPLMAFFTFVLQSIAIETSCHQYLLEYKDDFFAISSYHGEQIATHYYKINLDVLFYIALSIGIIILIIDFYIIFFQRKLKNKEHRGQRSVCY